VSKPHDKFCWVTIDFHPGDAICCCADVKEIREDEIERIIKLLEGEMCEKNEELVECWCGSWLEAIALIKEQNKGTNE